jgi:hypothetical protein
VKEKPKATRPILLRLTSVMRGLTVKSPSNRFVVIWFVAVLIGVSAARMLAGQTPSSAISSALLCAFSAFLAWALAREIDPDFPGSANFAAVVGALVGVGIGGPLGPVIALMFALRVVVRTTGSPPTRFDLIWLPGLAGYAALQPGGWIAGLGLAAALAWDTLLVNPTPRVRMVGAGFAGLAAVTVAVVRSNLAPHLQLPTLPQWLVIVSVALSLLALRPYHPRSVGDHGGKRLSAGRLTAGRALVLGVALVTTAWLGGGAVAALGSLFSALIGIGLNGLRRSAAG